MRFFNYADRLLFIALISICINVDAQMIKDVERAFQNERFFNPDFIRDKRVKTMTGTTLVKKDNDIIRSDHHSIRYTFNHKGLLESVQLVERYRNRWDTVTVKFVYDWEGRLINRIEQSEHGEMTVHYTYLNDQCVKEVKTRAFELAGLDNIASGAAEVIAYDSLSYDEGRVDHYNQYGRLYKSIRNESDEQGLATKRIIRHHVGNWFTTLRYRHDEAGRINKVSYLPSNQFLYQWKKEFEYDELGYLSSEHYSKMGVHQYSRKLSYFENGLLELNLTRHPERQEIRIIRYQYTYY